MAGFCEPDKLVFSVSKYLLILFLETNTYRTPLYGQPSWWGEDDANNKEDRRQEEHYSGNGGDLGWEKMGGTKFLHTFDLYCVKPCGFKALITTFFCACTCTFLCVDC